MPLFGSLIVRLSFIRSDSAEAYLLGGLMVALATALRLELGHWLAGAQFVTFFPAVLMVTLLCGSGPGWLSVVLSTLSAWIVIMPPQFSIRVEQPGQIAALAAFCTLAAAEVLVLSALKIAVARIGTLNATLAAVFDANPDAILLLDRLHRIVRVNGRASALFGYGQDELLGSSIERLLPQRLQPGHVALREACSAATEVREMASGGQPAGCAKDGREFPVNVLLGPIRFERELLVVAIVRDITMQTAAAKALAESQRQRIVLEERERGADLLRRWSDAFENAAFGIAITDPRTNTVQLANAAFAAMRGMTRAEARQMPVPEAYPEDELPRVLGLIAEADRTGHAAFESWHRHATGPAFPVAVNITSVRDSDGGPSYRIVSVLDITERRRTEEALRQAQKLEAVGSVAGGIAHDFNNLLGVIVGNLDLLAPLVHADPTAGEYFKDALDAALAGADLTRRLLAFARRQPLHPARLDVNGVVDEVARLLARLLGDDIRILVTPGPGVWPVVADCAWFETSLANLATNARDAMPGGGTLQISTANREVSGDEAARHPGLRAGDYVLVEVSDTGEGISPEIMNAIFEPFFTTKEPGKGTGLGLSMVFGFSRQSGGAVTVRSEPGRGSTFCLYLPRAVCADSAEPAAAPAATPSGQGASVLVVDDNPAMRRTMVRQLAGLGYGVLQAEDGKTALAILAGRPVDLLFSDVTMPGGMNGFELARAALEQHPDTAVLLTSAFPEARLNDPPQFPGVPVRLLKKPYRREELAHAVRDALDKHASKAARSCED
jgi:PAS domain S-box-containing protein